MVSKLSKIFIGVFVLGLIVFLGVYVSKPTEKSSLSVSYSGGENNSGNGQRIQPLGVVYDRSCTPESGYNYCYEYKYEYCYGSLCSHPTVRLQFYDPQKDQCINGICVGDMTLKWKVNGDHLYLYNTSESWSSLYNRINCYKSTCESYNSILSLPTGEMSLAKIGQPTLNYCPKFVGINYDYVTGSDGSWTWAYAYLGWGFSPITGTKCDFYTYLCDSKDNRGCLSNQYCSGNTQCLTKECESGDKSNDTGYYQCTNYKWVYKGNCKSGAKCVGLDSYTCNNFNWNNNGKIIGQCNVQCLPSGKTIGLFAITQVNLTSDEKCVGYNLLSCSNYTYLNKGVTGGKCGVECLNNTDCTNLNYESQPICQNGSLMKTIRVGSCDLTNYKCKIESINQLYKKCVFNCNSNGQCYENTSAFKISIGGLVLVLSGVIVYIFYRHKKHRRK